MAVKKIGILGGISPISTVKYYEYITRQYYVRHKNYYYPEIVIYSLNFQQFTDYENDSDKDNYISEIMKGVSALQNAGADFIIMAANSPHAVFDEVEALSAVPLLSIVKVAADQAQREGLKTLLLTGIKFTMQSSFYIKALSERGIRVLVPMLEEQNEIDRIIFEELAAEIFTMESKNKLLAIINNYRVDGVILGCTELPLILKQEDIDVRLLNTLELHAEAALDYAMQSF